MLVQETTGETGNPEPNHTVLVHGKSSMSVSVDEGQEGQRAGRRVLGQEGEGDGSSQV